MSAPSMTGEQIEREISVFGNALAAMTGNVGETKERRLRIHRAAETGERCGACGEAFANDAILYRRHLSQGRMLAGWSTVVAPVCEAHAGGRSYLNPVPCQGCGRPVRNERSFLDRRRTACSRRCAEKARYAEARGRRAEARGDRTCPVCNETFEPTRSDSKFCSSPCRQKAYRRRVTDAEHPAGDLRDSRNELRVPNLPPAERAEAVTVGEGAR